MRLFSPAKLNLFFRVIKKRGDGYHDIASIFQTISLGDTLDIELSEKDSLTCTDPSLPLDNTNLIYKALDLFRRKTGKDVHAAFHLDKKIPMQAGLGGGSSNAATALWGLNELTNRPASAHDLIEWAAELGSDVSFFFSQGTAYCTGRGELVNQLPSLPRLDLWLAKPSYGLSTPLVYQHCDLSLFSTQDPEDLLIDFLEGKPHYFNDLEIPAFKLSPELSTVKQKLLALGFEQVTMTGSGTAFFCFGNLSDPKVEGLQFYPARFINRESKSWY
jgi:4-diphosphocytidyl-2-C-methyl-D-erythritol kinase